MADFDFAEKIMETCMPVFLKYHISEGHIADIYKLSATLGRFPYAKAIESALLDKDFKCSDYVRHHTYIFKGATPIELSFNDDNIRRGYNWAKSCFDHFTADMRNLISASEDYKSLSQDEINRQENTHFSDSFIKQIKYRLLDATFFPNQLHSFGISDWAYREDSAEIFYPPIPWEFPLQAAPIIRILDKYLDETGKDEIPIVEAGEVLYKHGKMPEDKDERLKTLQKYLDIHYFGTCSVKRGRRWFIIRSHAFWPPL